MKFRIGVILGCALLATAGSAVPVIDNTPTRVQTPLRVNLRQVGTLKPKPVGEISTSRWTVDCAGMDREHVDWRSVREYAAPLGIARMRQQAGWARCEKDPGRYDFAWLDQAVFDAKRMGISTWLELSYGNPAYKGGGGRQLGAGFPVSEEGLAAWDRWVEKIVTHYKGTVRDFCVWNEPDLFAQNDPDFAVGFAIRTAEIIKRIEPEASIAAFALSSCKKSFVEPFVRELARRGKAQLFTSLAYHHYAMNPDADYEPIEECRRIIAEYAPNLKLMQGEGGTWSEWGEVGALQRHHWTEFTQAKYDLRRSLGDLGHGDDTEVFHLCDMEYRTSGFHDGLVRYGLLKTSGQAEGFRVLKVKAAYYAIQNAVSVFNDALECLAGRTTSAVTGMKGAVAYDWRDRKTGLPVVVFWDASDVPSDSFAAESGELRVKGLPLADPVWVDLLSGDAYALDRSAVRVEGDTTVYAVPVYDSPTAVTDRSLLDLEESWRVRATSGWRDGIPSRFGVEKARVYGPFARAASAKSEAELQRHGPAREISAAWDPRRKGYVFDLKVFYDLPWAAPGAEPDYSAYLAFTVDVTKGGKAVLYEQNDWYGQFYVNGKPVGDLVGNIFDWSRVEVPLKSGMNEILFRTSPGSGGFWWATLGVERP